MDQHPTTFKPSVADLAVDRSEVIRMLGYQKDCPDYIRHAMDTLWYQAQSHITVSCGYCRYQATIGKDRFECQGLPFECGPLIIRHLKGCTEIAAFVSTLGLDFDRWIKGFFDKEDPLQGYIANTIGSVLVEAVADWLQERLEEEIAPEGLGRSNRVSPGYCQWNVNEQHKLFSLLPERFCDITLMASALMVPIKSVAGVIGLGKGIVCQDYACQVCDKKDCIMRRHTDL
jgi:hypothetical protein